MALLTLQMPALPDPVRVVLKPATTALLVFDVVGPICERQPICAEIMVPAIVSLLTRARQCRCVGFVLDAGAQRFKVAA